MLPPGPGTPPEDVARNQRERLFGAMVASVAARGYAATRVTDLIKLSGVSRRSFYDLFPDKEACFLAVVRELVSNSLSLIEDVPAEGDERARHRFRALAELVVAQPAAARLCAIDTFAAGAEALKPLDAALRLLEGRMQAVAAESPERAEMPPEMISALIGATLEVVRTRLRRGTEGELLSLGPPLLDFLLAYRPPPKPLRLTIRPPTSGAEALAGHDHAERALRAFAVVVAEEGYANTTIDQVVKRASMSPTTFYAHFDGKEDALRAAIDNAGAQIAAAVLPAFRRVPDWPSAIRAAFGALFNFLASRPALAHLLLVDVYAIGPEALARRDEALRPLQALVEEGSQRAPSVPPIAIEVIFGGMYFLAYRQVNEVGAEGLPGLAPLCSYLALAPYVGPERACEAANADGRPRSSFEPLDEAGRNRGRVLYILGYRPVKRGLEEISRELEMPVPEAERWLRELEQAELVEEVLEDGDEERFYRPTLSRIGIDDWEALSLPRREQISQHIIYLAFEELNQATRGGSFDQRPERFLSRVVGRIDEQGWRQLSALHEELLSRSQEVVRQSEERLGQAGSKGFELRSFQTLFEMPEKRDAEGG